MVFDTFRTRFLYKPLDAVMTASLSARKPRLEYLRSVLSPRSSHYHRVASLVGLIDRLIPGTARWASGRLLESGFVPFAHERIELMDSGSGSTVFLLETRRSRSVMKVYRRTIGRSRDDLLDLAAMYRNKYETVSSWYAGPYPIVAPASFLVLHGPLLGRPAVACLQPYIEGEKSDFFGDFDDGELVRLMKEDDKFREQFALFARRTLDIHASQGLCGDLLGARNLMVTRHGESRALTLIDYGIFDLKSLKHDSPAVFARIAALVSRLQSLLDAMSLSSGGIQ